MSDAVGGVVWSASRAKDKADKADAEYASKGSSKHKGSVANQHNEFHDRYHLRPRHSVV